MRHLFLTTGFAITTLFSFAQDILVKKNGEEVKIKTIEIGFTEIKYKNFETPDGPTFIVAKSEVFMIKFENGTKEVFKTEEIKEESKQEVPSTISPAVVPQNQSTWDNPNNNSFGSQQKSTVNLFAKGEEDAKRYYTKYTSAGTGNFFGGFCLGICGIPIPLATANAQPKTENLGYPDANLFNDPNYRAGYISKASSIKRKKVWNNYAIGLGISTALNLIYYVATPR